MQNVDYNFVYDNGYNINYFTCGQTLKKFK